MSNAFGASVAQTSIVTDLADRGCIQYDYYTTVDSAMVTVLSLAAHERVIFKLYRDQDHASDTYGEEIGVTGVVLTYSIIPEPALDNNVVY